MKNDCVIIENIGVGDEYDFEATTIRGAKMILKREFTKNPNAAFTIGFVNNTEKEIKEYDKYAATVCDDIINGWRSK